MKYVLWEYRKNKRLFSMALVVLVSGANGIEAAGVIDKRFSDTAGRLV